MIKFYNVKDSVKDDNKLQESQIKEIEVNNEEDLKPLTAVEINNTQTNGKVEKNDKQSFEDFKNLYKGVIDMKCNQEYGSNEDKDLWEDTAKELYLKSKEYLPTLSKKEESNKLQEEEITPANIKEKALKILPKEDVDVRDSDLYIKVSDKSKELINKLQFKNNGLLTTFRSPIDNEMWYDIPFANLEDYITSKTESYYVKLFNQDGTDMDTIEEDDEDKACKIAEEKMKEGWRAVVYNADNKEALYDYDPKQLEKKKENKLQLESRDRVAENLSKFIYDLTTDKDTEAYGETAWSGNQPTKMGNGVTVYEVYKNGKSNYTMDDIKKAVIERFPELDVYGTAYNSILFYKPQKTESKLQEDTTNLEYNYMLLDRLKQDCEYFLGNGNGNAEHSLWAKDIDEQIAKMKELYNSFADNEKPEWITIEDINDYEKKMKALKDSKEKKTEVTEKDIDAKGKKDELVEDINNEYNSLPIGNITITVSEQPNNSVYLEIQDKNNTTISDMFIKDQIQTIVNFLNRLLSDNKHKPVKEESAISDYTLSEINKVLSSNGNEFTIKIVNSNEDAETKTLNIDREDLIWIYNVLGGNKDELIESRPDKQAARDKMFRDSKMKLKLPNKFKDIDEIVSYLEKCDNKTDVMNVNVAVGGFNRQLHNDMLDFANKFIKENGYLDTYIDKDGKEQPGKFKEFKQSMIDFVKNYNLKKKEEKLNDYTYVIYRQRLVKAPVYVKDYSTETEDINEAITFPTEQEAEEYKNELELSYKEQYKIGVKD